MAAFLEGDSVPSVSLAHSCTSIFPSFRWSLDLWKMLTATGRLASVTNRVAVYPPDPWCCQIFWDPSYFGCIRIHGALLLICLMIFSWLLHRYYWCFRNFNSSSFTLNLHAVKNDFVRKSRRSGQVIETRVSLWLLSAHFYAYFWHFLLRSSLIGCLRSVALSAGAAWGRVDH